jgi:hypothetical protein
MMKLTFAVSDCLALSAVYATCAGLVLDRPWLIAGGLGVLVGCVAWMWWRASK